jgi:site-specific recombinase XerD
MLLQDALDSFLLMNRALQNSTATVDSYRERVLILIRFLKERGKCDLESVQPADIDAWIVSMLDQKGRWHDHPCHPQQSGGLSPETIAGRVQATKTFFEFCRQRQLLLMSPAGHIRKRRFHRQVADVDTKVMAVDDLRRILNVARSRAEKGQPRDLALMFALSEGLRAGEVASMKLVDLDLTRLTARVSGKSGTRRIEIHRKTGDALSIWLEVRGECEHQSVFVGLHQPNVGRALTSDSIYQILRRMAREAEINGRYNPHSIRHLAGQHLMNMTDNLEIVRLKLGHATIETAKIYANQRHRVRRATDEQSLVCEL